MSGPARERVGVILQARMGSSRLPGKVLRALDGRPLIAWVVARLRAIEGIEDVVVATSNHAREAPLVAWAQAEGVSVFRGDEDDVLDRYVRCMDAYGFGAVVRATGDNPMVCPVEGTRLVELYRQTKVDYAAALGKGCGLPTGAGLEIFDAEALRRSAREGTQPHHREHVNELILEQPHRFRRRVQRALPAHRAPSLSLTVDTPEELAAMDRWYAAYRAEGGRGLVPLAWVVAAHLALQGAA